MRIRHLALAVENLHASVQKLYAATHQSIIGLGEVAKTLRLTYQATQPARNAMFCPRPCAPSLNVAQPVTGEAERCNAATGLDDSFGVLSAAYDRPPPSTVVCWFGNKCRHFAHGKGYCKYFHPPGIGGGTHVLHPSQNHEVQPTSRPALNEMHSQRLGTTGLETLAASKSCDAKHPEAPATIVLPGGMPVASGSSHWFMADNAWLRDPGIGVTRYQASGSPLPGDKELPASTQSVEGDTIEASDNRTLDPCEETVEPDSSGTASLALLVSQHGEADVHHETAQTSVEKDGHEEGQPDLSGRGFALGSAGSAFTAPPDRPHDEETDSDQSSQTSEADESDEEHPAEIAIARLSAADQLCLQQLFASSHSLRFTFIHEKEECHACTQRACTHDHDNWRSLCLPCLLEQAAPEGNPVDLAGDPDANGKTTETPVIAEAPLQEQCSTPTQLPSKVVAEAVFNDPGPVTALAAACADKSHGDGPSPFVAGNGVLILGLTSAVGQKLNMRYGTVVAPSTGSGRIGVLLDGTSCPKALLPSNLHLVAALRTPQTNVVGEPLDAQSWDTLGVRVTDTVTDKDVYDPVQYEEQNLDILRLEPLGPSLHSLETQYGPLHFLWLGPGAPRTLNALDTLEALGLPQHVGGGAIRAVRKQHPEEPPPILTVAAPSSWAEMFGEDLHVDSTGSDGRPQ